MCQAKKKLWAVVQGMDTGEAVGELDRLIAANACMQVLSRDAMWHVIAWSTHAYSD